MLKPQLKDFIVVSDFDGYKYEDIDFAGYTKALEEYRKSFSKQTIVKKPKRSPAECVCLIEGHEKQPETNRCARCDKKLEEPKPKPELDAKRKRLHIAVEILTSENVLSDLQNDMVKDIFAKDPSVGSILSYYYGDAKV